MSDILPFLRIGADGDLLPWSAQLAASQRFQKSLAEVEDLALNLDLLDMEFHEISL